MKESMCQWFELNTALFLFNQQQWERYFLSMGEDTEYLKDVNIGLNYDLLEILRKNLDENRLRFLDSMEKRFKDSSSEKDDKAGSKKQSPLSGGFFRMMRTFHQAFVPYGRLEIEIYNVMAEFWENITKNLKRKKHQEGIDPDVLKEILEQFNEDIRAVLVSKGESDKSQNSSKKGQERASSQKKKERK